MEPMRSFKLLFLALLTLWGGAPDWSMQGACRGGSGSLACLRLCARADRLLSEGGRRPLLGASSCRVSLRQAPEALLPQTAAAPLPPAQVAAAPAPAAASCPLAAAAQPLAGRSPPPPPDFLASSQPSAQAPPAFA